MRGGASAALSVLLDAHRPKQWPHLVVVRIRRSHVIESRLELVKQQLLRFLEDQPAQLGHLPRIRTDITAAHLDDYLELQRI
jgi:hypothetical protein